MTFEQGAVRRKPLFSVAVVLALGASGVPTFAEPPRQHAVSHPGAGFAQVAKLTAADGRPDDQFGSSTAISGDLIVVGAEADDDLGPPAGSAYVFRRDAGGRSAWAQVAELRAFDGRLGDFFGASVAIDGDTVVVGAYGDDRRGSAYIFQRRARRSDSWSLVAKIVAQDGVEGSEFGEAVAISGDTVVVGAPPEFSIGLGSAYIFQRDAGGPDTWGQVAKVQASAGGPDDSFGSAVAISVDTVVVGGATDADLGTDTGSAYIFQRNSGGPGAWGQVAKLKAPDGAELDGFGSAVAIDADLVVVGASGDDDLGGYSGSAYIFQRDSGGPGAWGQAAKLLAADGSGGDFFGNPVSLSGDLALIGASGAGAAYVLERNAGGADAWGEVAKLTAAGGRTRDFFASGLAIDGATAVVGAEFDDGQGVDSGSAYVFEAVRALPAVVIGDCPRRVTIGVAGATPGGTVVLLSAAREGSTPITAGPCAGRGLGLTDPALLAVEHAGEDGRLVMRSSVPAAVCGGFIQAVDAGTCRMTDVLTVP